MCAGPAEAYCLLRLIIEESKPLTTSSGTEGSPRPRGPLLGNIPILAVLNVTAASEQIRQALNLADK
jgi:hypothetical protein